jgi:hypothetical protein
MERVGGEALRGDGQLTRRITYRIDEILDGIADQLRPGRLLVGVSIVLLVH